MKKEKLGTFYIILGYLLLPFIGLYKLITDPIQNMTPKGKVFYYILLFIVAVQIGELIEYLF